jgi:hypothetical protein
MIKRLIEPENIIYLIIVVVAVFFGVGKYGWIPILRTAGLVIFLAIAITNTIKLYKAFTSYLKVKKWNINRKTGSYLVISYLTAVVLYFVALTEYYQKFVLLFVVILMCALFILEKARAFVR